MSKSIALSPKHGLNPTIPICFFCGCEKNEVALLGKLKGDAEAPKNVILDYEPCEKCKQLMSMGITIISASTIPVQTGMSPIIENQTIKVYPTGDWCVIKDESDLSKIFKSQEVIDNILKNKKAVIDSVAYESIFGTIGGTKKEDRENTDK